MGSCHIVRFVLFLGCLYCSVVFFFFSSRRRHTRFDCDWSSDVCSSDLCVDWHFGIWYSMFHIEMISLICSCFTRHGITTSAVVTLPSILSLMNNLLPMEIGRASCRERV